MNWIEEVGLHVLAGELDVQGLESGTNGETLNHFITLTLKNRPEKSAVGSDYSKSTMKQFFVSTKAFETKEKK